MHHDKTITCRPCLVLVRKFYYERHRDKVVVRCREDYEYFKSSGICVHCRTAEAAIDHLRCAPCAEKSMKSSRVRRQTLASKGQCPQCGKRKVAKTRLCSPCLRRFREKKQYACKCGFTRGYKELACALCLTVGACARMAPIVIRAWRKLESASVYELAEEAKTTTRTVWRTLARLKAMGAVEDVTEEGENMKRWKLLVAA